MKFAIRVEEIIGRTIIVKAEDLIEAIEKVEEAVSNGTILLDGIEDFCERNVCPSGTFGDGVVPDGVDVSWYEHLE